MNQTQMKQALRSLDTLLAKKGYEGVNLLIGGGAAFALAYQIPIQTADIDGVLFKSKIEPSILDPLIKATAKELGIAPDWLNPYFGTFLFCLPSDYGDRLKLIFKGKVLQAHVLGLNDILIMKCFAGREKDMLHTKLLLKKGADASFVEDHIERLKEKNIPGSEAALDFLIEAEDQLGD